MRRSMTVVLMIIGMLFGMVGGSTTKRTMAVLALSTLAILSTGACGGVIPALTQGSAPVATSAPAAPQAPAAPAPAPAVPAAGQAPSTETDWSHGRGSGPDEPFNKDELEYLKAYGHLAGVTLEDGRFNKDRVDYGWISCTDMSNGYTGVQAADTLEAAFGNQYDATSIVVAAANYLCPENHSKLTP